MQRSIAASPSSIMRLKHIAQAPIRKYAWPLLFGLCVVMAPGLARSAKEDNTMSFALASTAFAAGGNIPSLYTCDGDNVSPPLAWTDLPSGTKSLALIVDDPDAPDPAAPQRTWVHWVLYNLPPSADGLPQHVAPRHLPPGTHEGANDWRRTGYGGPCPPTGRHRYFFKLYALDAVLPDLGKPSKAQLEQAMEGHVIGKTELIGLYQRK